jgi:apolipoprotein N-acyltransferase
MVDDVLAGPQVESSPATAIDAASAAIAPTSPALPASPPPPTSSAAPATTAPPARPRPLLPWWAAIITAVASGLVQVLAFPPIDQWYLAPVGVALFALATYRRRFWGGFGLGMLAGLAVLVPLLDWAGGYVGAVWLALPIGEGAYFALLGGLSALATPVLARWRWSWPIVTGVLWVLQEALRDRTPFGGFPWGRLAFSQGDSPLLRLAELGGAPLVTFGVAALGGLLAWAVLAGVPAWREPARGASASEHRSLRAAPGGRPAGELDQRAPGLRALLPAVLALTLVWAPLLVPAASGGPTTGLRVAIVQGNVPRLGLEFNAQREAVLNNHVDATLQLAADVQAGRQQQPDLVVWPENASDVDPIHNADAGAKVSQAADAIGVPILVGGLLEGPGPKDIRNVGIVWNPGTGPAEIYTKRHPVPFAEYIPMRSFVRLITKKVDLVRNDFIAGATPGVMTAGKATLGDVICFEVAYDDVVRDTVTGGAQLLVVQTNNATFNDAEASQQLAMVRLRAVEHGRPALMASTVGISAFVDPDGTVHDATGFNQQQVIVRDLQLRTGRTMATELGSAPELALVVVALAVLVVAVVLRRRKVVG